MKIIENIPNKSDLPKGSVLTIGNFDGVHNGHQEIIAKSRKLADKYGGWCVALTFDPHPVAILHPEKTPGVLTPLEYKSKLLQRYGVDCLIVIKDSLRLLNMSPDGFVDDFIMGTISPAAIVEGTDFNFGYGRSGNCDTLKKMGREKGFEVEIVQPLKMDIHDGHESVCSSSLIRQFLETGQIDYAAKLLGRNYRLMGSIVKGRGKGGQLGYPTANIEPLKQIIPAEGVYGGYISIKDNVADLYASDQRIPAAFSLGRIKTFEENHPLLIEAHLLSESPGDIYGKFMAMDFVGRLRNQQRFETQEKLVEQIHHDCRQARELLGVKG